MRLFHGKVALDSFENGTPLCTKLFELDGPTSVLNNFGHMDSMAQHHAEGSNPTSAFSILIKMLERALRVNLSKVYPHFR